MRATPRAFRSLSRGRARDGEDADGAVDALDEGGDHGRIDDARARRCSPRPPRDRHVRARPRARAASPVRRSAPRKTSVRALRTSGMPVSSPTARTAAILAVNRSIGRRLVAAVAQILHVEPDRPDLDDPARGCRSGLGLVAVAGLHVGGHGQVDRAGDRGDGGEHLLARQVLPVGVPERVGSRGARRRDCAGPGARDHDSARRVPRVEQQQRITGDVEIRGGLRPWRAGPCGDPTRA